MLGKKRWMFFRRLKKETTTSSPTSSSSPPSPSSSARRPKKFFGSAPFKWRRLNLQLSFIDTVLFKVVSVFEAVILVTTLA
ncbi:hypothetical protein PanWU01x14_300790, partial [Parasponia andersonii]